MDDMTDHAWPADQSKHVWGEWHSNTGPPKPTEYRSCVHPDCKATEIREVANA